MHIVFVYPNPRTELAEAVARGEAPDTALLGQNHLGAYGIDATIHQPTLRRAERVGGLRHRVTWNLRELALPWELGDADVVATPLATMLPLMTRVRRRPRVLLFNYGLLTLWGRSHGLRRQAIRATMRSSAWIVCLDSEQLRRTRELPGIDPARVHLVEFGVDAGFYDATPVPAEGHVLAVGRDLARDYATLAEAARGLDAKVIVVTEPHNLAGIELPHNVEHLHRVSHAKLRELYAGARCVVLPLHPDGHPQGTECSGLTALLESMASARPIVLSQRAVFADYAPAGDAALHVPPGDPAELRSTIERVLGDDALSAALGARAREEVEARLTTNHLAARLARLLQPVAN